MRFFFFRLGKVSDFRFCFYHLMIEANAYLYFVWGFAILVGWVFFFFENTFGLGLLGICLGLKLGFFFWL